MKILHEKSKCCGAKIVRFGGKRRQCTACKKTWSVHAAKRGPKSLRQQCGYLKKVFVDGMKVKQLVLHSTLPPDAIYKRFANSLNVAVRQKRIINIQGQALIMVIDAEWHYFKQELWTLYFVAVKPVGVSLVVVLDPALKPGKENAAAWNEIFNQLPPTLKKRIIALVSDGIRGIETIAADNDWIMQRCHFHLLSALQKMRGKRASTHGRLVREEIYQTVKQLLLETEALAVNRLCQRLAVLSQDEGCPIKMRMAVRDFLRRLPEFRSYLEYPALQLPTTINVMESINSFVRIRTRTTNTPQSWHKWATACVRFKSKFTCK